MKKLIPILVTFLFAFTGSFAQSTSPRWSTNPTSGNATGSSISFRLVNYTFVSGVDTLKLIPNASETLVQLGSITDSILVQFSNIKNCSLGDQVTLIGYATSATRKVKIWATNSASAGTASPASGKRIIIVFIFDGVKWIETSRFIES